MPLPSAIFLYLCTEHLSSLKNTFNPDQGVPLNSDGTSRNATGRIRKAFRNYCSSVRAFDKALVDSSSVDTGSRLLEVLKPGNWTAANRNIISTSPGFGVLKPVRDHGGVIIRRANSTQSTLERDRHFVPRSYRKIFGFVVRLIPVDGVGPADFVLYVFS